jgi:FixJ family two-component response regulator
LAQVTPVVFIVDDDVSVRESVEFLVRHAGWQAMTFASAREFVSYPPICAPSCLILDVGLPDINGLDLQQQISEQYHSPIIFLTGYGDVRTSVRALKAGAFDFLTKPFHPQQLRDLVQAALAQDCERRDRQSVLDSLQRRFESLTPREREVLPLVVTGLLNKQAAAHLGISEITLQIHRTSVMRKNESSVARGAREDGGRAGRTPGERSASIALNSAYPRDSGIESRVGASKRRKSLNTPSPAQGSD